MSVLVSRTALGLAPLDICDGLDYYVSPTFFGGQVSWNRTQVTSPFVDGSTTTNRTRQMVTEPCTVEIITDNPGDLHDAMDALVDAMIQDAFTITITMDGETYKYQCEAADYQRIWMGPREIAHQGQLVLSIPRQPVALVGVV